MIGKLPKPEARWTPGKCKYMGRYNPLEEQVEYEVDEIATYHDICYDMGKNKGDCDRQMVKSLDEIPYGEMPKWGQTARFLIDKKQKQGLGVPKKTEKAVE